MTAHKKKKKKSETPEEHNTFLLGHLQIQGQGTGYVCMVKIYKQDG